MRRRFVALLLLVACVAVAACGRRGTDGANEQLGRDSAPSTVEPTTTTTAPPAETTTTLAPATTSPLPPPPAPALGGKEGAKVIVSPAGVILPVLGSDPGGYRVSTPCGRPVVIGSGTPLTTAAVVLDPGHGGFEPGALGPNGLTEKVLNLAVTGHAKAALEKAGLPTVLTRTADYRITLETRGQIVNALKPKAFVSIHHNAEPDGPRAGPGAETYFQVRSPESKRLSGLIYEEIVQALSAYQIAWVADTDAGAKFRRNTKGEDYYGIIRRTQAVPSVLAELGFISNPPEEQLYTRPDVQQVEGEAVAKGIIRFLTTKDPGSGFVEPYARDSPAGSGGGGGNTCVDPAL